MVDLLPNKEGIVLITGSSGLIGNKIAQRLSGRYRVVGMDPDFKSTFARSIDTIPIDFSSDTSVQHAFDHLQAKYGKHLASVIHLASYYDHSGAPSEEYRQITFLGTQRILRELRHFYCDQFIYSSSLLVHAPCKVGQKINEDSPIMPKWNYPASKVAAEQLLFEEHHDMPLLILRLAEVYDDFCHSMPLALQMQRIFERKIGGHMFPGDASHGQSFVHLNDTARAFERAVDRRQILPNQLTLLIGEPQTSSYDSLQRAIGWLIHRDKRWQTRKVPKPLAKIGVWVRESVPFREDSSLKPWMIDVVDDHFEPDISLAETYLGWQPQRSLRKTLPRMALFLKDQPIEFYASNRLSIPGWLRQIA